MAEPPQPFQKRERCSKVKTWEIFNKAFLYPAPLSNCLIFLNTQAVLPLLFSGSTWASPDHRGYWGTSVALPGYTRRQEGKACSSVFMGISMGCRDAIRSWINYVLPSFPFDTSLSSRVCITPLSTQPRK